MSTPVSAREQQPARTGSVPVRNLVHLADLMLAASLGCWAAGVATVQVTTLGPYGLPANLPVIFYAGVALLVLSVTAQLARRRLSRWRMSVHVAALVLMLYGTAPLVYSQGRYSWLYKTVGVVQYTAAHGRLNPSIDIYQNWPGFFALAAWFDKIAGVPSPLAYAKWAQLVFELAALPLLYLAYGALPLGDRQRWIALLLYSGGNWIGQDYFAPQALGTVLSLGIMAIALRWLIVPNSAGPRRAQRRRAAGAARSGQARRGRAWPGFCVLLVFLYCVLVFTHELSPYLVVLQLGALAAARLLRPRSLPLVLLVIAIGYLLPRFGYVNEHYGVLSSLGDFFANAEAPKHSADISASEHVISLSMRLLSLLIWGLAAAGTWLLRRSRRTVLTLVMLACSPVLLLGLESYGQEAVLRVYLFCLPWVAVLAAAALTPGGYGTAPARPRRAHAEARPRRAHAEARPARWPRGQLRLPLALSAVAALFFPAFYGNDSFNVMTATEVTTLESFAQSATPGPIFSPVQNGPLDDTSRYNLFPLISIFGSHGLLGSKPVMTAVADKIANDSLTYTNGRDPAYVVITSSMIAYSAEYDVASVGDLSALMSALAKSPAWELRTARPGVTIYEFLPVPVDLTGG